MPELEWSAAANYWSQKAGSASVYRMLLAVRLEETPASMQRATAVGLGVENHFLANHENYCQFEVHVVQPTVEL